MIRRKRNGAKTQKKGLVFVFVAMFLECCAPTIYNTPPPPPGPVTDADGAIKIAKWLLLSQRDNRQHAWSATLSDGVWHARAESDPDHCDDIIQEIDVVAATGSVHPNPTSTVVIC